MTTTWSPTSPAVPPSRWPRTDRAPTTGGPERELRAAVRFRARGQPIVAHCLSMAATPACADGRPVRDTATVYTLLSALVRQQIISVGFSAAGDPALNRKF